MQQLRLTRTRRVALIGLAGALAVSLSACAESKREEGAGGRCDDLRDREGKGDHEYRGDLRIRDDLLRTRRG